MSRTARRVVAITFTGIVLGLSGGVGVAHAAPASTSVPFTDPDSSGLITLCNKDNQPMTNGSVLTQPFVWKAISSSPAPKRYQKNGLATLYAYQPVQNEPVDLWTGDQLSAAGHYTNKAHPAAALTIGDEPLSAFTSGYPPRWDGYIQLRMYYTALGLGAYHLSYPTAIIKVTGNTWTVVQAGDTPCTAGKSLSTEINTLKPSQITATPTIISSAPTKGGSHHKSQPSKPSAKQTKPAKPTATPGPSTTTASDNTAASTGSNGAKDAFIGLGVLIVVGGGAALLVLRRRAGG